MGTVFNIQHFSIHDGPGIRTVVFLKGCPLRCKWCANPESQKREPEMGWTKPECIKCGACVNSLDGFSRFEGDELFWDNSIPVDPDRIKKVCPTEAFHIIGEEMNVSEVLDEVLKDSPFFMSSGGGITVSGGEPMMQPNFTYELLKEAGKSGLHRAIETCMHAPWDDIKEVLKEVDYLLTDVKTMDSGTHKEWTGADNALILENLKKAREKYPYLPIHVRTPVIPGVNDNEDEISKIIDFVNEIRANYELLPYHRLGIPKYESLHRFYPMGPAYLQAEDFQRLESFAIRRFGGSPFGRHYGPPKVQAKSISNLLVGGAGI